MAEDDITDDQTLDVSEMVRGGPAAPSRHAHTGAPVPPEHACGLPQISIFLPLVMFCQLLTSYLKTYCHKVMTVLPEVRTRDAETLEREKLAAYTRYDNGRQVGVVILVGIIFGLLVNAV